MRFKGKSPGNLPDSASRKGCFKQITEVKTEEKEGFKGTFFCCFVLVDRVTERVRQSLSTHWFTPHVGARAGGRGRGSQEPGPGPQAGAGPQAGTGREALASLVGFPGHTQGAECQVPGIEMAPTWDAGGPGHAALGALAHRQRSRWLSAFKGCSCVFD